MGMYTYGYIYTHIHIQWNVYIYSYTHMSIKKNEIMSFAVTWMDLEIIILSELSQAEEDKCHMISLLCGI